VPFSKKYINDVINSLPANSLRLAGGNKQKWNISNRNASQEYVEQLYPSLDGKGMVKEPYDVKQILNVEKSNNRVRKIDDNKLLVPLHVNRNKYNSPEELYRAIRDWWINLKHREERTINDRIRYARAMANHSVYPVDWFKFEPEQIINQLLFKQIYGYPKKAKEIGKNKETYGICQLHNDWKTVNTFAEALCENISYWGYTPPPIPEPQKKIVPRPYLVHQLMHTKYSNDRYTNVLVKTILTVGFQIGWRPEEAPIQKISDIYFDDGYLIIKEPKKKYRERQVWIDDRVINSPRQNSLHNLTYIWRPRYATEESGDFLFIQKNGKPFPTVDAYRMFLNGYCKPMWNNFSPKIMRDWCAIGTLIRTKIETKKWDIRTVRNKLGHRTENTTEAYVKFAEEYYRNDPYDWLSAVLKFHQNSKKHGGAVKQVEPSHLNRQIEKRLKSAVCGQSIRRKVYAPVGIRTRVAGYLQAGKCLLYLKFSPRKAGMIGRTTLREHFNRYKLASE